MFGFLPDEIFLDYGIFQGDSFKVNEEGSYLLIML
jgi:hypothetical protein